MDRVREEAEVLFTPSEDWIPTLIELEMSRDMTNPTKWLCAQRRLRSAWAPAQSDQSLCCALNG